MASYALIWDLETVTDLDAFRRLEGRPELSDADARELHGEDFAKLPLHQIACIGALIAQRQSDRWKVLALGAPHIGQRSERELIEAFLSRLGELRPQLVSFNGHGFDLPVLRYRSMLHLLSAPALYARPYFNRFTDDSLDLCDALASFDPRSKMSLDALCRVFGIAGKPEGIDGSKVSECIASGRIQEVADYCETDIVNTYLLFLRYELLRGSLDQAEHEKSIGDLLDYLRAKHADRPHLAAFLN
jgi:predicted PolB exonuclease-like 3'-5' exonuclease